jgi:hypothetical protein
MHRVRILFVLVVCLRPGYAGAQTSDMPVVLQIPVSARVAALGNAWVAGRDQDVVFSNPAQLVGARPDLGLSLAHLGPERTMGALSSVYAAGKLSFTLGWGAVLLEHGDANNPSALGVVGGAVTYKGFRAGASGKYLSDNQSASTRHAWLSDIGIARNLFGGAVAASLQNVGFGEVNGTAGATIPKRVAVGWSAVKQAGPLDLGLFTQIAMRKDHTSPAAGIEIGYGWIEGYLITFRAGARRTELADEHRGSVGAALTADRLTIEYALQGFDEGNRAQLVTMRWR